MMTRRAMKRQMVRMVTVMQSQRVIQTALIECCAKLADIITKQHAMMVQMAVDSIDCMKAAKTATGELTSIMNVELEKMKKVETK